MGNAIFLTGNKVSGSGNRQIIYLYNNLSIGFHAADPHRVADESLVNPVRTGVCTTGEELGNYKSQSLYSAALPAAHLPTGEGEKP